MQVNNDSSEKSNSDSNSEEGGMCMQCFASIYTMLYFAVLALQS